MAGVAFRLIVLALLAALPLIPAMAVGTVP